MTQSFLSLWVDHVDNGYVIKWRATSDKPGTFFGPANAEGTYTASNWDDAREIIDSLLVRVAKVMS